MPRQVAGSEAEGYSLPVEDLAHLGDGTHQTLHAHLEGVARRTAALAAKLGLAKAGELIGLLHDLGEATGEFQEYLRSFAPGAEGGPRYDLRGRVDHSTAEAQCLIANIRGAGHETSPAGIVARMLALCIASHHSGLIDCLSPGGEDVLAHAAPDTRTCYQEAWKTVDPAVRARAEKLMQDAQLSLEFGSTFARLRDVQGDRDLQLGLLARFLFSCLIDADRTDTADFEKPSGRSASPEFSMRTGTFCLCGFMRRSRS